MIDSHVNCRTTNKWLLGVWSGGRNMKISHSHYLYLCIYSPIKFTILFVTFLKIFCLFGNKTFKSNNNGLYMFLKYLILKIIFTIQEPEWLIFEIARPFLLVATITVANLIIWLIDKFFHRFSVINNIVLSELTWKELMEKVVINVRSRIWKSEMQQNVSIKAVYFYQLGGWNYIQASGFNICCVYTWMMLFKKAYINPIFTVLLFRRIYDTFINCARLFEYDSCWRRFT